MRLLHVRIVNSKLIKTLTIFFLFTQGLILTNMRPNDKDRLRHWPKSKACPHGIFVHTKKLGDMNS